MKYCKECYDMPHVRHRVNGCSTCWKPHSPERYELPIPCMQSAMGDMIRPDEHEHLDIPEGSPEHRIREALRGQWHHRESLRLAAQTGSGTTGKILSQLVESGAVDVEYKMVVAASHSRRVRVYRLAEGE